MNRIIATVMMLLLSTAGHGFAEEIAPDGETLFKMVCADTCHQTPKAEHLSPKQWKAVLNTMQQRMTQFGMAPLSEDQFQAVLSYLQGQARGN